MNRRGLFGFLGGAAVAGPKLAKGIAENVAEQAPAYFSSAGSCVNPIASEGDWRLGEIACLKKIISGNDPQAKRNKVMARLYAAESQERVRLDGLRYISPVNKMRMLQNGAIERSEGINRAEANFSLANLLGGN